MNKKLLCSTALAGALVVSGSALAELKVGGNITHTTVFAADKSSSTATGSGQKLGTEMNITLSSTNTLKNGMYMSYKANIEFDEVESATPDVEYEIQLGQGNFYIGAGSDAGNNISSTPTLPAVGYTVGTLVHNTGSTTPVNYDGLVNRDEANNSSHLSLNYKTLGGVASIIYSPNVTEVDNDNGKMNTVGGARARAYIYQGSPVANTKFIIGRNEVTGATDASANNNKTDKIGISYDFGQAQAGYERQKYSTGDSATEKTVNNYNATFKASDSLTLGVQHSRSKIDSTAGAPTEKLTALSAGYNLGPASIAVSLIDGEAVGGVTATNDTQGIMITTKMGF